MSRAVGLKGRCSQCKMVGHDKRNCDVHKQRLARECLLSLPKPSPKENPCKVEDCTYARSLGQDACAAHADRRTYVVCEAFRCWTMVSRVFRVHRCKEHRNVINLRTKAREGKENVKRLAAVFVDPEEAYGNGVLSGEMVFTEMRAHSKRTGS